MKTNSKIATRRAGLVAACALACIAFAQGCNTTKGAGQDIKAGGKAIENAAERTQDKM